MNRFKDLLGAAALAGVVGLGGCSDGIRDRPPVIEKELGVVRAIDQAAYSGDPARSLMDSLRLTPNQLIDRVKRWIPRGTIPQDAINVTYTLENREYTGFGGVLMESGAEGLLGEVHKYTPAHVNKATFVIVQYQIQSKKGLENKEKVFALRCSNGLVQELSTATVTATSMLLSTPDAPQITTPPHLNTVVIPPGGSLNKTLGVDNAGAKRIAETYRLKQFYKPGKFVVIVQPGDTFTQQAQGTWVKQ